MARRSALINVMVNAAMKAARGLRRDFGEVEHLQVSKKGPADFVSMADKRAEQILHEVNPHPPEVALTGFRLFDEPVRPGPGPRQFELAARADRPSGDGRRTADARLERGRRRAVDPVQRHLEVERVVAAGDRVVLACQPPLAPYVYRLRDLTFEARLEPEAERDQPA